MSREVPLLTSEKIKLVIVVAVVVFLFVPLLWFGAKELYRVIVRDTEGYEKSMDQAADYYNFKVVVYRSGINSYNLDVDVSTWRAYDTAQKKAYCEKCQESIYKIQQKYKMQEKDNQPSVFFFINGFLVADYTSTGVMLY